MAAGGRIGNYLRHIRFCPEGNDVRLSEPDRFGGSLKRNPPSGFQSGVVECHCLLRAGIFRALPLILFFSSAFQAPPQGFRSPLIDSAISPGKCDEFSSFSYSSLPWPWRKRECGPPEHG